jgi:hypothetical protein
VRKAAEGADVNKWPNLYRLAEEFQVNFSNRTGGCGGSV